MTHFNKCKSNVDVAMQKPDPKSSLRGFTGAWLDIAAFKKVKIERGNGAGGDKERS